MRARRAGLALGLCALLGLAAWGGPAVSEAAARAPSDASDCVRPRVLLLGDSNIYGSLGKYLAGTLPAFGFDVVRRGKPTSGLARPDFFDWFEKARELLDSHHPEVVIIMLGGNDGQRLERVHEVKGRRIWWKQEAPWRQEYAHRVAALMELLSAEGRRVFFLSPTNRRPRIAREKMGRVREVQRNAAAGMERVTWMDMFPMSSDEHGNWLSRGLGAQGEVVRLRRRDGIHLTPEGGGVVGRRVITELFDRGLASCE